MMSAAATRGVRFSGPQGVTAPLRARQLEDPDPAEIRETSPESDIYNTLSSLQSESNSESSYSKNSRGAGEKLQTSHDSLSEEPDEQRARLKKQGSTLSTCSKGSKGSKVSFSERHSTRSVAPYGEIYGESPKAFDFDKDGNKVKPSPIGLRAYLSN
mmetsp:Transcript_7265/g.11862  ORF Transcript_7265/g.11862 Transcript_7265/m.11862 type:complete len:157 (-) Transcript_7265:208-678(-)